MSDNPNPVTAEMLRAIEVFTSGFTFIRSFTHPYQCERVGPVWVMRDAPRKRGTYRTEEWVAFRVQPAEIDRIARKHARGRFTVCVLTHKDESDEPIRAGFRELDYRLHSTEPLMNHPLAHIPRPEAPVDIQCVRTADLADRVNKAARSRQVLPEHLVDDPPLREYVALVDDEVVGWVGSIMTAEGTWCSNMYVKPNFRRRGIARSMLSLMLRDDRESGAKQAVLLASHAGAKLYPVVGYEQIGTLFIYTPQNR